MRENFLETSTTSTIKYATESRMKIFHNLSLKDKINEGIRANGPSTAAKKKRKKDPDNNNVDLKKLKA